MKGKIGAGTIVLLGTALVLWARQKAEAAPPEEPSPPPLPPERSNLYGKIIDAETGQSLREVKVAVYDLIVYTDANGNYEFLELDPGGYTVTFEKEGYEPAVDDIVLVQGNNELNVALTPVVAPTKDPFTFAKPECSGVTFKDADAFDTMTFSCLVTNDTNITMARTLTLRWYYCDKNGCISERTICHQVRTKTLDPEQSYQFSFNGNSRDPVTGAYCGPLISRRQEHYMWLRDENGYESERCRVSSW